MKNIIGKQWRTSMKDCIGIIAVKQGSGKWRAYIGISKGLGSEELDAQYIADWGSKLVKREAVAFFPNLDSDNFDEK